MFFKDFKYDSDFTGSAPNVAAGDRTDDQAKFNVDYYAVEEGQAANKLRFAYSHLDVSVENKRVVGERSDEFEDDAEAVFEEDAEAVIDRHMGDQMSRVIDRRILSLCIAAIPAANKVTFDAQPAANPTYGGLAPSEQDAYDQRLFSVGIVDTIESIRNTRAVRGRQHAELGPGRHRRRQADARLKGFKAIDGGADAMRIDTGAKVDMGVLTDYGLRLIVDPLRRRTRWSSGGVRPIAATRPSTSCRTSRCS